LQVQGSRLQVEPWGCSTLLGSHGEKGRHDLLHHGAQAFRALNFLLVMFCNREDLCEGFLAIQTFVIIDWHNSILSVGRPNLVTMD
jgi:hypothetical protein